jgi:CheY-like chemotaxis protein
LVEDNEDTLRVMARVLKSFGYGVETATGVKAALVLAERERFDLLVSDIGLPDGSGWDIMRELGRKQSLRGIALSGYGLDEDVRKSREAGFEQHLTKPVNFQTLREVLNKVAPPAGE